MKLSQLTGRLAVLGIISFFPFAVHALDLVGAYDAAVQHDPSQLAANEAVLAGREKSVQGDALLRPRVGFQAGVNYVDDHMSNNVPGAFASLLPGHSTGTVHQAAVQLTQPLYDASASATRSQLHQQTKLAETEYEQAQQNLMQRVSEAYFGVLLAQDNLRVAEASKAAIGLQRDRAQARFDVGRGKITDLQEAQARFDQVLTQEINAKNILELRRAQLQELVGSIPEGLAEVAPGLAASPPMPDSLSEWQQRGEVHSSLVRERQSQLEISRVEIDKFKASGRPSLNLVAAYASQGQSGGLSPLLSASSDRNAAIGLQLTVPLYAGGGIDSREREAIARRDEAEDLLAAAKRDVRLQVQDAFLAVKTGVARIASSEQYLKSARSALAATTLGRDVGTRTELDVLDAQQRALTAEFDAAQAKVDYLLGRIRLAAAVGELSEVQLRETNGFLSVNP